VFKDIYGPKNFFLEVQPNGMPEQDKVNEFLVQLSRDEGIDLVATNDCQPMADAVAGIEAVVKAIRELYSLANQARRPWPT
jgi:DNA polymerase-3 subunit alpha